MSSTTYRRLAAYSVAITATVLALLLSLWLHPYLVRTIGAFFYIAVMVSTGYGGMGPGLVTIVLSTLAIPYFIPPIFQFAIADSIDLVRLGIFALTALSISLLSNKLRLNQCKVEQLNQQLLQETGDRLQMALAAAQMGMWDWNIVTGEIIWSPEHERLFGLVPGTFDGRYETFDARLHPDDRDGLTQAVQSALQSRTIYQHEYRIVWADGSVHWVEGRGQALYNEAGQAVRMSGTVMSIDQRKQAEIALTRSEQQLRAIFEAEPECVKVITVDGIVRTINPAGLTIAEIDSVEQALGQCIFPLIHPAYQQVFLEFNQQVANGKPGVLEFEGTGLKGTHRWLESHAVPLQLLGESTTYVLAVTRDVTDRKWAEAELKRLNTELEQRVAERTAELSEANDRLQKELFQRERIERALQESELKFHAMFDQSRLFIGLLDPNGIVFEVNQRPHELTERMGETFVGRPFWELAIWGRQNQRQMKAVIDRALTGEVVRLEIDIHTQDGSLLRMPDGSLVTHDIRVKAVKNAADQVMFLTVEGWDISDRKRTENTLREQAEVLRIFYESSPLMLGMVELSDNDILHLSHNATTLKFFGITAQELTGKWASELNTPPEYQQLWVTHYRQSQQQQQPIWFEYEDIREAQTRWLSVMVSFLGMGDSQRPQFSYSVQDISARKRLEAERKRAEHVSRELKLLEMILDIILAGYWDWDLVNDQEYLSPGFKRMFGYEDHELPNLPETWQKLIDSEDLPGVFECFNHHVQSHGSVPYYNEVRYRHKNGSTIWVICLGQVIEWDAEGKPLRMIGCHIDISDRKRIEAERQQAEENLRASEERFRSAFEDAAIGMALVGTNGRWLRVNRAICDIVGYSNQELLKTDFQTITHPDDLTIDLNYVHQLLNGEIQTYQMEKRYFHKHGHIVWVLLSVSLVRDEQNQPLYFISQIQNISDRKWAEAALQESELKFHALFDQSSQVIALVHPDGTLFETNQGSRELTEKTGETILGRLVWELDGWGRENQSRMKTAFEHALVGEAVGFEINLYNPDGSVMLAPDGSLITHDIMIRAIKNAADQVMFLTISGWDISPLKQAEAALQASENKFRSLNESSPIGVFMANAEGQYVYTNPRAQEICGYGFEEGLGEGWSRFVHPDDLQAMLGDWTSKAAEQKGSVYEGIRYISQDGTVRRYGRVQTVPILEANGTPTAYMGTIEDITEQREIDQMKSEFISIVSHELRTPLTSMQAALSLLVEKIIDPTSEEGETIIQIASEGVDRLVRLVSDMLDLERLESGKTRLEKRLCHTDQLIATATDQMQEMANQAEITLDVTSNAFELNADPDRLLQVLINLLSNAIKFSEAGSTVWLTVEQSSTSHSRLPTPYLLFTVKDQGRGIPAHKLESIFERFQQVDASDARKKGGTGLGLAICRSIVEQHDGRIWTESSLEQGSRFSFIIPSA